MFQLTITCAVCEAQRSTHNLEALPALSHEEVLVQAGHVPSCEIKATGKGIITQDERPDAPNTVFYRIAAEVS